MQKKEKKKVTSKEKNHASEQNLDMSEILELSEWEFKITLIGKSSIAIKEIELVINTFFTKMKHQVQMVVPINSAIHLR